MVPYREGFDFGMGVNAATADPLALGIQGEVTPVEGGGEGGTGGFALSRVETTDALEEKLGISASVSAGIGLFSTSARFAFARECKVRSTSLTLVIHCTRQFGFKQIDKPKLNEESGPLVRDAQLDLFARRYGDCFVRGILTGGQFFGVIRVDTQSEDSRRAISGSIQGGYGLFKASVESTFAETVTKERASVEVFAYWEGGRVTGRPTTPAELIAAAGEWSTSVESLQRPYFVTLAPYVLAVGPEPPNEADLQHQRDVLIRCAKLRSATIDKLNLLEYMLDPRHAGEFGIVPPPAGPDLAAIQSAVAFDLELIADAASFALDHPREAMLPETFAREKRGLASYAMTALPSPLPAHIGTSINAPDFTAFATREAAETEAAAKNLKLAWAHEGGDQPWKIVRQVPLAGTPVSIGGTVNVTSAGKVVDPLARVRVGPRITPRIGGRNF